MESLIETFHIDIKLLIAQIINFAIVFFVLYKFALKPISKIMQDRTKTIEKSLADAKEIEERLAQVEHDYSVEIIKAKKEATIILQRASDDAQIKTDKAIAKSKEEIGQIMDREKEQMHKEKAQTLKEIRAEVADLVTASVAKILEKNFSSTDDEELIKKYLK